MAAALMVAMAFACIIAPAADASFSNIDGETNVIEVSGTGNFDIIYSNTDIATVEGGVDIAFTAKLVTKGGAAVSSGSVSPSSGDLDNGVAKTLKVTAPSSAGSYKLVVSFDCDYQDEEGKDVCDSSVKEYAIKVVKPITLTVNLTKDSDMDLNTFQVYFIVDGEKMDDSITSMYFNSRGSGSVSYNWIADASNGKHTFSVEAVGNADDVQGLGETYSFYVGDNSYTAWIVLAVLFVVLMVIVLIWVIRKPVINRGKPKSRR